MENILYNAIFTKIQKEIKNNADEILKVQNIDNKYCKIKIEINKFLEIIEKYKYTPGSQIKECGRVL